MALEIQIGGDTTDWNLKVKEVERDIKELSKEKQIQIKAGLDTTEITKNIRDAKKALTDLKTTLKDSGDGFNKLAPKVANGGNALMQFSRIAQDAPFGIMGIGNNITATVEAFGHLKNSTGSTGGALKAMASSIMGSGGILLAVSLVTSGLTYMAQNGITVGDVFDKLTGTFDRTSKAMQDVSNEAVKNSGAEIASMNALVAVAKDETATRKERLAAVQQLQKEYPAYFGSLTKEQILSGKVEEAVKAVTFALIQKSKAQILANRIADNDLKILELQQKGQKTVADFTAGKGLFAILSSSLAQQALKQSIGATAEELDNLQKEQKVLTLELEKSTKAANTFTVANENAKKSAGKKANFTPQVAGIKSQLNPADLVDTTKIAVVTGKLDEFGNKIKSLPGVISTSMGGIRQPIDTGFLDMLESLQRFNDSANQIIQGAISDTFSSLGVMIGNSLAGADGGLKDAGKNILGILGNFMTQFGELMISTGVGLVIAKKMLTSGNGYAMIAGGVALVAIGTAFSASAKKSQKSAGDSMGGGGGSVSTGASYSSPSSTSSSSGFAGSIGNGTVVFEIAGQKLVGVLSNTLNANARLGGKVTIP